MVGCQGLCSPEREGMTKSTHMTREKQTTAPSKEPPAPVTPVYDAEMTGRLFQSLFTGSPVAIEIYDAVGRLIDANQAFLETAGVNSVDDLRGLSIADHPGLSDKAKAALRRGDTVRGEIEFDFEKIKAANLYPTSRSGSIYLNVVVTPLGSKNDGGVKGYVVQIDETTERRRAQQSAEQALRESEERYGLLAEYATDGIYRFRLDPPGYEYVSPAMTDLFGYEREEWLADPDLDHKIVHPDDQPLIDKMHTEPTTFTGPIILRCQHKDGRSLWIEHHNAPILVDDKPVAIQGIVRDVTERVRAMEDMERLRNEFLAMVTHELKTPLAAIKGSAATALHSPRPLDLEEGRELFQIIDEQSDRLRDLADNLLDMSRIEAGSLSVKPEPINLADAIDEAKATLARAGRPHPVNVEMPEDLPPVNADKRRLVQVLSNLLNNAAKFASPDLPITIAVEHDPVHATVRVRDRGQGIVPAKLPFLFQKFSQVHDGPAFRVGTGLGLAISKGIVEAHGGRIGPKAKAKARVPSSPSPCPLPLRARLARRRRPFPRPPASVEAKDPASSPSTTSCRSCATSSIPSTRPATSASSPAIPPRSPSSSRWNSPTSSSLTSASPASAASTCLPASASSPPLPSSSSPPATAARTPSAPSKWAPTTTSPSRLPPPSFSPESGPPCAVAPCPVSPNRGRLSA